MRRTVSLFVVASGALLGALALTAGSAGAANLQITDVGWWSRQPGASAPQGGFAVADAPDAPVSKAAIRVPVSGKVVIANIKLEEAGGTAQDLSSVRACGTSKEGMKPNPQPGSMDQAPAEDCAVSVALKRDGTKWSGDVSPLLRDKTGNVSIMFVPGESSGAPAVGALGGWSVQFNPPVIEGTEANSSSSTTTTTTTTKASPATSAAASPPSSPPSTSASPAPASPVTPAAPVSPVSAPSAPATTAATATTKPAAPAAGAPTGTTLVSTPSTVPFVASGQNYSPTAKRRDYPSGRQWIGYILLALVVGLVAALVKSRLDGGGVLPFPFKRETAES